MRQSQAAQNLWNQSIQGLFEQNSNQTIQGNEVLKKQQKIQEALQGTEIASDFRKITNSVRESISNSKIANLPPEIGGQYSKKGIELNYNILHFPVHKTIQDTASRIDHTFAHEKQHEIQNDEKPLLLIDGVFMLGGETFSSTEIIEAINMHNTGTHTEAGAQVVSLEYLRMYRKLEGALRKSQFTIDQLTQALTNRDLTEIDDRLNFIGISNAS